MVDLGGVVVLNGGRGVVQHSEQVLLHVPYLGGVHSCQIFAKINRIQNGPNPLPNWR